jgi:transcriptional regulator with PAS, ATPase and Fis domain
VHGTARRTSSVFLGVSPVMATLHEELDRLARSDAKVLITGESGVGKEVVAREIHSRSPRITRPFVPVNCAGLPESLLESELFGHVKGSFTGAFRDKAGKLEIADGGTLFLDEVGDMTVRMQGLLLRFLETGELQKVGADRVHTKVDLRVIAATHRDLRELIVQQQFREDLFYRLNVIHVVVPPLRERREDIKPLVDQVLSRRSGKDQVLQGFSDEAMMALRTYHWPGNVRELENVVERLMVTCQKELAQVDDLPVEIRAPQRNAARPKTERRRTVADDLFKQLTEGSQCFWNTVYPLYMQREITRSNVRDLVRKGLEEARGNYKIVVRLFNMPPDDYKKFLNFLRKHDCQVPFKEYR